MEKEKQYKTVIKIRCFEEKILSLFSENKLSGTTHTYIGEEATAASIMKYVGDNDVVFSNHRCHGHYLAYGGPMEKLLAEIMSKEIGLCQGRGGSQHIRYKNFFTNGIQGGIVPNALGVAFAKKLDGKKDNTVVFIGDGTLGQGVVYESLNIASVYEIPLVVVVEDNQYAMSTKRTDVISGDICTRLSGFNVKTFEIESTDVDELNDFFKKVFDYVNTNRKPVCAVVHNYRLGAHSKGDDTRPIEEVQKHKAKDPVLLVKEKIGEDNYQAIKKAFDKELNELVAKLEKEQSIRITENTAEESNEYQGQSYFYDGNKRCVELISDAFDSELNKNKRIIIYGEDVCDPYGGAFKATKGLSTKYPNNVFNMPISEQCMVGMGVGMAMFGKIPVVEMMFGDFITLGFDQLLNHATKYSWVYGGDIKVPLVVRMASGGKRGYGPTHSQSLEKYLIGIPLIKIVSLSSLIDPRVFYNHLFSTIESPTVVLENKKLYSERIISIQNEQYDIFTVKEVNNFGYPTIHLSVSQGDKPDYYIVTYGGMVNDAVEAAKELMMNEEISVDVIVLTQIAPLPIKDLKEILENGSKVIFVEEGNKTGGIGAEFISTMIENNFSNSFYRIASLDIPIPNGIILEQQMVPNKETIIEFVKENYYGK